MSFVKHIFNKDSSGQITIEDIQKLIDNKTEESLHLDYEEIPKDVQYDGLAEHISGFLNTSGGIVVFGVSEREEKGRHIPYNITWSAIKKETLENNLYRKIDPWHEEIQIFPLQKPDDKTKRIFIVSVKKSKNPPHMSNYRYYIRLNFQTQPTGHDQVLSMFKQYYLQKYDLINTVYGTIYNELISYLAKTKITKWEIREYDRILREKLFLLAQDWDLYESIDSFYERVSKWNLALDVCRFRMAKIINNTASLFFKKQLYISPNRSALKIEIIAESTHQVVPIDEAILNGKDPLDFWKVDYPFAQISKAEVLLEHTENKMVGTYDTMVIPKRQFSRFMKKLKQEVKEDKLISHTLKELEDLQSEIDELLKELEDRM